MKQLLFIGLLFPMSLLAQDSTWHRDYKTPPMKRYEIAVNAGTAVYIGNMPDGYVPERWQRNRVFNARLGMFVNPYRNRRTNIGLFYSSFSTTYKIVYPYSTTYRTGRLTQAGVFINRTFNTGRLKPFVGFSASTLFQNMGNSGYVYGGKKATWLALGLEGGVKYTILPSLHAVVTVNYNSMSNLKYCATTGGLAYRF